jgi:hypothetical protein
MRYDPAWQVVLVPELVVVVDKRWDPDQAAAGKRAALEHPHFEDSMGH